MERFYHHVVDEGMSLGAALREAQIWLRSSTRRALDEYYAARSLAGLPGNLKASSNLMLGSVSDDTPYSHPYYWAAFSLTGV
jgi:CHAT domain-containing protein